MNMYEAIFVKKSVKKFVMEEVSETILNGVRQYAKELPMLMDNAEIEYEVLENVADELHNPKIYPVKAPYYFIIACDNVKDQLLNAGYLAEQISLYLTSRGLGTSYANYVHLQNGLMESLTKEPVIVIGFGTTKESIYRDSRKNHRLSEKEIAVYKSEVSSDIKLMVKAARLAPSYLNNQPWRMVVYDNRIHIFCKKNVLFGGDVMHEKKLIDIGVMAANIMLVAEELWVDVSVEQVENISNKMFKNNDYIVSILLK